MPATEFEVPDGLTELLQEFTVAVLRSRPENLTVFARDYFERKYLNEIQDETYEKNNNYSDSDSGVLAWIGVAHLLPVFACNTLQVVAQLRVKFHWSRCSKAAISVITFLLAEIIWVIRVISN